MEQARAGGENSAAGMGRRVTLRCLLAIFVCAIRASPQGSFEIHVYEYEPLSWHQYSLEAHLHFRHAGTATRRWGRLPFPTLHQTHLTLEPTIGVSPEFAVGFMFLNAWQPGYSPQFAGWRVLPHFYAPESWNLPMRVGFVAEFSFQNTRYEENSHRVELRPILDREFTRWQVVFNPVFERALHGPGTQRGVELRASRPRAMEAQDLLAIARVLRGNREHQCSPARSTGSPSIVRRR